MSFLNCQFQPQTKKKWHDWLLTVAERSSHQVVLHVFCSATHPKTENGSWKLEFLTRHFFFLGYIFGIYLHSNWSVEYRNFMEFLHPKWGFSPSIVWSRSTSHPVIVTIATKDGTILVVTAAGWGVVLKYDTHLFRPTSHVDPRRFTENLAVHFQQQNFEQI